MTEDADRLLRDHLAGARKALNEALLQVGELPPGSVAATVVGRTLEQLNELIGGLERLIRERDVMQRRQALHVVREPD